MKRLRVNPILCDGYGYCAELFPEGVTLDDWGFPILADVPLRERDVLTQHAKRAVKQCPRNALFIEAKEE